MALLSVGLAAPLRVQTTNALDYVDHINVDFAHLQTERGRPPANWNDGGKDALAPFLRAKPGC